MSYEKPCVKILLSSWFKFWLFSLILLTQNIERTWKTVNLTGINVLLKVITDELCWNFRVNFSKRNTKFTGNCGMLVKSKFWSKIETKVSKDHFLHKVFYIRRFNIKIVAFRSFLFNQCANLNDTHSNWTLKTN